MELKLNTPIPIEEIDFRVQSINKGGYATILAYKDARVDMNRLDAVYGVEGWQKKYDLIDGHLFCSVGIWSKAMAQWIWKQDVGTESNTEKEKGEASDAFKRACFNLGIGRELYAYPLIQVALEKDEWELKNEKPVATWNLKLKEWAWNSEFKDGKLVSLSCIDNKKKVRFTYPSNQKQTPPLEPKAPEIPPVPQITEEQKQKLIKFSTYIDCFSNDGIKAIIQWVAQPQTFDKANAMIKKYQDHINTVRAKDNTPNIPDSQEMNAK